MQDIKVAPIKPIIKGARTLPNRPDLDLIELYDPDIDAWGYIGDKKMVVKIPA